jgi:hypothetical protein
VFWPNTKLNARSIKLMPRVDQPQGSAKNSDRKRDSFEKRHVRIVRPNVRANLETTA